MKENVPVCYKYQHIQL